MKKQTEKDKLRPFTKDSPTMMSELGKVYAEYKKFLVTGGF